MNTTESEVIELSYEELPSSLKKLEISMHIHIPRIKIVQGIVMSSEWTQSVFGLFISNR